MPYYRILVWTTRRKEPFTGIRLISDSNINSVYQKVKTEADRFYRYDYLDVEVQMLSKLCKAVREFEKKASQKAFNP